MERKFAIITDSGCDMPTAYYESRKVTCIKLGFTMDNVNYEGESGERIDEKTFYARLRNGAMPTTYQVTGETAKEYIEKNMQAGKDVLVLAFSSGLSGTAGSFVVAGREMQEKYPERKIFVVDSLCASMGEGLLLDYVCNKADTGASIEETAAYAEELKLQICHFFTVDNLFHLKRGGRVSAATAIFGSILKIKPVLHVSDEGKLVSIGKCMGRKKALHDIVERLLGTADLGEGDPIFISHGDCIEDVEYVCSIVREKLPNVRIEINYVGTVIGTHAGCGTVAIFCKGKKR